MFSKHNHLRDTNLFFTEKCHNSVFKEANHELKLVDNWLLSNKLSLNIYKTSYIVFRTPNAPLPVSNNLYLRGKALNRVESLRFLGIIVHEHLSWKPHMELLLQKIRINTAVVRRIQHYLNQEILLLLYNSMVKSHLQYCILTWCNGNKTLQQTLQRAANKFIRLIFKLNYRERVKNTMQQNHILTINQLFEIELACFMHRYDHGNCHWLAKSY